MRKYICFLMASVLIISTCFINHVSATQTCAANFNRNYSLSGNQANDMVTVAQAQVGKTQGNLGYTEAWCADFVLDVARLVGVSQNVIPYNYSQAANVTSLYNYMVNNCGAKSVSSPKAGDLIFYKCSYCGYKHVGIVSTNTSQSIEGNNWTYGYSQVEKINSAYAYLECGHTPVIRVYIRPNYGGGSSSNPSTWVKTNKSSYVVGETVTFTFGYKYGTSVSLGIDKNGSRYATPEVTGKTSYSRSFSEAGTYSVYCSGWSQGGYEDSSKVTFTVTPNTYSVSYNANGGSGAPSSQTKTHGVNLTLSSAKPTRVGYTFKNWNTAANGSGTSYNAGGTYSANAGATLYAQWTANRYTVSYNANGGNGAPGAQTKTHGVNLTLSSAKPTRVGYTFKNWNTAANGSGTSYNAGGTYSANAGATLYAQWTVNSYTVGFNANGGTTPTASKAVTYNSTYGTLPTPTRTGHTFTGWYTAASGGTRVNADTKVTITANQTLYAQWSVNSYGLNVRPMGGTWEGSTEEKAFKMKYGESKNISDPTRKGYQFVAWTPMGYGTFEPWGKTLLKPGVSPQFYNKESLQIYNNAGNGSVKIETVAKEASCPTTSAYMQKITTLGTAKPGLGGFIRSTASKANGVFYHVIIAKIPEGYNIYMANNPIGTDGKNEWITSNKGTGRWETYIYKVTCGATGGFSTFGHVYINKTECFEPWQEEATPLTPVTWYVGFSDVYDATGINSNGSNYTCGASEGYLQAMWRANDYTVRYNSNGGIGKMNDSSHHYDTEKVLSKNTFTKKYCRFKGWNTAPDGSGTAFADGASVKNLTAENGGTVTLYAQWERSVYTESVLKEYSGYSQLTVDIHGINKPARVIAAYYKDGRLVNAEVREYTSDKEIFALIGDFDTVKVMVWDGLDKMAPLTEAEVLKKQN